MPVNSLEKEWFASIADDNMADDLKSVNLKMQEFLGEKLAKKLESDDPKVQEYIERKSYLIALDTDYDIDMPPLIGLDETMYVATMGHKTNHWFDPNCYFGWAFHPRHGRYT